MKRNVLVLLSLVLLCSSAFAEDPKPQPSPADQKAAMQAMMKAMTPGENHKMLDSMVGTFDVKVRTWMQPGGEPMVSTGTAHSAWILGNRYVEEKFDGNFMGMPFSGVGHTGYDNVRKQFWSTWMDNMSTSVMYSTGSMTDAKTWKFTSTMADPMTGKDAPVEMRVSMPDNDHHTMEMWSPGPDGKMFKVMEIAYSRK